MAFHLTFSVQCVVRDCIHLIGNFYHFRCGPSGLVATASSQMHIVTIDILTATDLCQHTNRKIGYSVPVMENVCKLQIHQWFVMPTRSPAQNHNEPALHEIFSCSLCSFVCFFLYCLFGCLWFLCWLFVGMSDFAHAQLVRLHKQSGKRKRYRESVAIASFFFHISNCIICCEQKKNVYPYS